MSTSGPLSSRIAGNATHPSSQASPRRAAGLGSRSNSSTPRNLQCSESAAAQDGPSNPRRATALSAAGVPLRNPLTVPAGGAPTSADDRPSPAATAHESLSWSEHPDPRLSCTTGSNDRASGAVDAICVSPVPILHVRVPSGPIAVLRGRRHSSTLVMTDCMTSWSYNPFFSHRRGDTPCHCRPVAAAPSTEKRSALSVIFWGCNSTRYFLHGGRFGQGLLGKYSTADPARLTPPVPRS